MVWKRVTQIKLTFFVRLSWELLHRSHGYKRLCPFLCLERTLILLGHQTTSSLLLALNHVFVLKWKVISDRNYFSKFHHFSKENQDQPYFTSTITHTKAPLGSTAVLRCQVEIPVGEIQTSWFKDGVILIRD